MRRPSSATGWWCGPGRVLALGTPVELVARHAGPWALELRVPSEHQTGALAAAGFLRLTGRALQEN